MQSVRMNITLDAVLKQEIDDISKELGKSKSRLVADALDYYFDMLDLKIAEKRLQNSQTISSDDMDKWLNAL